MSDIPNIRVVRVTHVDYGIASRPLRMVSSSEILRFRKQCPREAFGKTDAEIRATIERRKP